MSDVLSILAGSLGAALDWFTQFITSLDAAGLVITVFTIFMIVRFLLRPFLGSAGSSDSVKKKPVKK